MYILGFYSVNRICFGFKTHKFLKAPYVEVNSCCFQGFGLFSPLEGLEENLKNENVVYISTWIHST